MTKVYKISWVLFFFTQIIHAQTTLNYSVTPFLDNKRGAVSLTFDDNALGQYNTALPIMNDSKYGFKGTFFTITNSVRATGVGSWAFLRDNVAAKGHEVASHTVTHRNLNELSEQEAKDEIVNSDIAIETNIPDIKCVTIAWPYGVGGDNAKVVAESNKRYIGARNAWGAEWTNGDPHDAWLKNINYNMNVLALGINPGVTIEKYTQYVAGSLQSKWLVFLYHGIDANEYDGPGRENFIKQMDVINSRKQSLWVAPFGEVMRYNAEKFAQDLKIVSESASRWTLSLTDTLSDNQVYNHPLTLKINEPSWKFDSISQNGFRIQHTITAGFVYINAVPDAGEIVFHKTMLTDLTIDSKAENHLFVFPNPAKNELIIKGHSLENTTYEISSSKGRVMQSGVVNDGTVTIDQLNAGLYLIKIKSLEIESTMKFVKE